VAARFRETLQQAVDDRLAGEPATVLMSGGLDSTTVAALAARRSDGTSVRALTSVHESLRDDDEARYAAMAAKAIGIPWETHSLDGYGLFERWDGDARPVLPMAEPLTAVMADLLDRVSQHAGVALSGDGGDPLLLPATVPRHAGRVPALDIARGVWRPDVPPPSWLAVPLRAVYDARARQHEVERAARVEPDVLRRESVRQLRSPWWPSLFESLHPAATRRAVDLRYPFFDRRVVEMAVALPSYPWCVGKIVVREAAAGLLPDAVRWRPKTPFAADPVALRRTLTLDDVVRILRSAPGFDRFVDVSTFAATVQPAGLLLDGEPGTLAAVSLALWLTRAPAAGAVPARPAVATA
jgi:asparagine synthase (glutamine-hydrolysing)